MRYLGKTVNLSKRLNRHFNSIYDKSKRNCDSYRNNWLAKHKGEISCTIIEEVDEGNWEEREKYWISVCKKRFKLINLADGGSGSSGCFRSEDIRKRMNIKRIGVKLSDETRRKISEAHKGKKLSEEHKNNLSRAHKGKTLSEEHKKNISLALKGIPPKVTFPGGSNPAARKVVQLTLTGTFIRDWECMLDVTKSLGIRRCSISECCRNIRNSAGGFKWKYKEDYYERC